ncbi:thiamine-phosphate kinase [Actinomadura alba]|uniref:Thiamine-monophosphate kinase n=1 Tax=Actinomadura alba TaxID=406431 RepID=A0ABR7LKP9_9ACTN|nr:thiamine-phosphate kinase [Actinomadura alba]MBC6465258.1 thiamine-phosphate kinase [Actinomadura alba]
MSTTSPASDEPTRLANIISTMFAGQAGRSHRLSNGETVQLLVGADAQDDCAVFRMDGSQEIVLGSDYVRGSKFILYELGYLDDYDVGYYLAMANFSDIAAMGAQPIALLSVIRYPKTMPDEQFAQVLRGINDACELVGAPNVGGDIGTAERLILSASAMGVVESGGSLLRSGARPGDRLCVTGPTGIAAAAQKYFTKPHIADGAISAAAEKVLLNSWRRPQALVGQGRCLSTSGLATSCQDSSDGLKAGIESIAARSGVGFIVEEKALPVLDVVREVAELSNIEVTSLILGDSVDFQLIFTVPEEYLEELKKIFEGHGYTFHDIGFATELPDIVLRSSDGATRELPGAAWRHANPDLP